jgi:chromosome segregation ATPase
MRRTVGEMETALNETSESLARASSDLEAERSTVAEMEGMLDDANTLVAEGQALRAVLASEVSKAEDKLEKITRPGRAIDAELARAQEAAFNRYSSTLARREASLASIPAERKAVREQLAESAALVSSLAAEVGDGGSGLSQWWETTQKQRRLDAARSKERREAQKLEGLAAKQATLKAEVQALKAEYAAEKAALVASSRDKRVAWEASVEMRVREAKSEIAMLAAVGRRATAAAVTPLAAVLIDEAEVEAEVRGEVVVEDMSGQGQTAS